MNQPQTGDLARVKVTAASVHAGALGIVSKVRARRVGEWEQVELLIGDQRRWFERAEIEDVVKERNPFALRPALRRSPCQLFVVLAREASSGVVFRRGPSRWVQLIRWNTETDTFTPGQWFHGRLYEQRADLSPDGTKLIYFAAKPPSSAGQGGGYSYAWTAISKPPFLTALALWPKQCSGTYFGGGLFVDDNHVWLNHAACEAEAHPNHKLPGWLSVTSRTFDPRYQYVFYERLHRDGWWIDPDWWQRHSPSGFVGAPKAWHEKPHPRRDCQLVMESNIFYGSRSPSFALQDRHSGEITPLEGATWADWDQRGRLVYAKDGRLLAVEALELGRSAAGDPVELANFNDLRPEPRESPAWAREW